MNVMKKRKILIISTMAIMFFVLKGNHGFAQSHTESNKQQGEIIGFDPDKRGCCWGWIIKIDKDTIKADKMPNKEIRPGKVEKPIKVYLEVGDKSEHCTKNHPYFVIKNIEIIKE